MRLGTYIFFGLIMITLVVGGIYLLFPESYSLSLMGVSANLPIAVWIGIPMVILYLFSIIHIAYYGAYTYLQKKKLLKDAKELNDALYWSLLKEPKSHKYSTPQMREGAILLNISYIEPTNSSIQGLSEKLSSALNWVKEIEAGKYVDLKAKKIERFLSIENPLLVKNTLNRLESEKEFVEEVLQNHSAYGNQVVAKAMDILSKEGSISQIKKYLSFFKKEHLFNLLNRAVDRIEDKEEINFTPELLEEFIDSLELNCQDYIKIAKYTIKLFSPDRNLLLFSQLAKEREKAQNAYLYLLFEYEMPDSAKQFLEEHDEMEFIAFRAFLALKESKYNFKIDDILDSKIACR